MGIGTNVQDIYFRRTQVHRSRLLNEFLSRGAGVGMVVASGFFAGGGGGGGFAWWFVVGGVLVKWGL